MKHALTAFVLGLVLWTISPPIGLALTLIAIGFAAGLGVAAILE